MAEEKNWIEIMDESELTGADPGEIIAFEVETDEGDELSIAMVRLPEDPELPGGWVAFENVCPHDGGALDDGTTELKDCAIQCARHGARFDMKSGKVLSMPAARDLDTYPLKFDSGKVYLQA